jgi:hypothetical protein
MDFPSLFITLNKSTNISNTGYTLRALLLRKMDEYLLQQNFEEFYWIFNGGNMVSATLGKE